MKKNFYLLLTVCVALFAQCSPEMQKSVQKTVVAGVVSSGIDIAKGKLPEREMQFKRVGKTNLYQTNDLLGSYKIVMLSDSTGILYANVNFEQIAKLVIDKMNEQIDKGIFVLKLGKAKEVTKEEPKTEEQPK